jgi:hypothetical protein
MSASEPDMAESWVPQQCTLPTMDQPLRVAEFDHVFAQAVRQVERPSADRVSVRLEPTGEIAARVADLAVRETGCCSFFTFTLTITSSAVTLDITVVPGHVEVLDALAARAQAAVGGRV